MNMPDANLPWKDIFTIGLATLGAVLGVMNTWNSISQRRVRVRVRPVHVFDERSGAAGFAIEIVNLSSFAVTIEEVGFLLKGESTKRKFVIANPIMVDGGPWPRRLQTRESITTAFNPRDAIHARAKITKAYARTACGEYVYGSSPALADLRTGVVT